MRIFVAIVVLLAVVAAFGMVGIRVAGDSLPGANGAVPAVIPAAGDSLPGANGAVPAVISVAGDNLPNGN